MFCKCVDVYISAGGGDYKYTNITVLSSFYHLFKSRNLRSEFIIPGWKGHFLLRPISVVNIGGRSK